MSACPHATLLANSSTIKKGDLAQLAYKMAHSRYGPSQAQLKELETLKRELKKNRQLQVDHETTCSVCILGSAS